MTTSAEFLNHVREVLSNYETVHFEESKLPREMTTEDGKVFLSMIYKAVKANEPESKKCIALKILTTTTTKTKKSAIINPLLSSKLWKVFCDQHRAYYRNNLEPVDPAYGDEYYMLLDHMLERFQQELGLDNDNVETPFSKYWRAIKMKNSDKSPVFSNLVVMAANLQADKPETIAKFKSELAGYQSNSMYNNRYRTFLDNYKKKAGNLAFFTKTDGLTAVECFQAKREFYNMCEKEFFFGDCNDKDYDVLKEIVQLEEKKNGGMGIGSSRVRGQRPETAAAGQGQMEPRREGSVGRGGTRTPEGEPRSLTADAPAKVQAQVSAVSGSRLQQIPVPVPALTPVVPANVNVGPVQLPGPSIPNNLNDSLDAIRNSFQPGIPPHTQSVAPQSRPNQPDMRSQISSNPAVVSMPKIGYNDMIKTNTEQPSPMPPLPFTSPAKPLSVQPAVDISQTSAARRDFLISSKTPENKPNPPSQGPQSKFAIFSDYPASRTPIASQLRPGPIKDPILEELQEHKHNQPEYLRSGHDSLLNQPNPAAMLASPQALSPIGKKDQPDFNNPPPSEPPVQNLARHYTFKQDTNPYIDAPNRSNQIASASFTKEGRPSSSLSPAQFPTPLPPASPFRSTKFELKQSRIDQISEMKFQDIGKYKSLCYLKKGKLFENEDYKVGVSLHRQVDPTGTRQLLIQCSYEVLPGRNTKLALFQLSHNDFKLSSHPDETWVELPVKEFFQNGRFPVLQIDQRNSNYKIVTREIPVHIPVSKVMFFKPDEDQLAGPDAVKNLKRLETDWYMLDHNFFKSVKEILVAFRGLKLKEGNADVVGGDFEVLGLRHTLTVEFQLNGQGEFKVYLYYNKLESETKVKAFLNELVILVVDPTTL